jgi:hypothetical protein
MGLNRPTKYSVYPQVRRLDELAAGSRLTREGLSDSEAAELMPKTAQAVADEAPA